VRREVIECDRCDGPIPADSNEHRDFAGRVYAATYTGTDRVGTSTVPADLCGGCMTDLVEFMGGRSLVPAKPAKANREREKA
jgi:hypothetical protein